MLVQSLLTTLILAGSALAAAIETSKSNVNSPPDFQPVFEEFGTVNVEEATGVDPWSYLPPARAGNRTETHTCITKNRPFEYHCRKAIDLWHKVANDKGNVELSMGKCKSVTFGCCQSVLCANMDFGIKVRVYELIGSAWSLIKSRCGPVGSGGVWEPAGWQFMVQVSRPHTGYCKRKPMD
ncbi:hypothetical protein PT974_07183 [Cladobotryum mycophilum]|uniref:Uncharacterized protein n=1 Tax=Cladobotryum mycophilum TaxID=491253 RepID=A0ABR0SNI8_9HYPO